MSKLRRIFVSYRRSDAGGFATLLVESLRDKLGQRAVFQDTRDIIPGDQFKKKIVTVIHECAVVIIVLGPDWLTVRGPNGKPRLENTEDLVHQEVRLALDQIPTGTLVIPVTVGGAKLPKAHELPKEIADLATLSAIDLGQESWNRDVAALLLLILKVWRPGRPLRGWFEFFTGVKAALAVLSVVMAVAVVGRGVAPFYLFSERLLAGILIALSAAIVFTVWNGWHPGPRRLRYADWKVWSSAALLLPVFWMVYGFENPLALTPGSNWQSLPGCDTEYYVQPYTGSSSRWQPTVHNPNASPCEDSFGQSYQEVTLRAGLAPWRGALEISTAQTGFVEAILVPANYLSDVTESAGDGTIIARPAAKESVTLKMRKPRASFMCWFRLESPNESVFAQVTLWSPFKWKAAEDTAYVPTQPRPSPVLPSNPASSVPGAP